MGGGNISYFFVGGGQFLAALQNAVAYQVLKGSYARKVFKGTAKLSLA